MSSSPSPSPSDGLPTAATDVNQTDINTPDTDTHTDNQTDNQDDTAQQPEEQQQPEEEDSQPHQEEEDVAAAADIQSADATLSADVVDEAVSELLAAAADEPASQPDIITTESQWASFSPTPSPAVNLQEQEHHQSGNAANDTPSDADHDADADAEAEADASPSPSPDEFTDFSAAATPHNVQPQGDDPFPTTTTDATDAEEDENDFGEFGSAPFSAAPVNGNQQPDASPSNTTTLSPEESEHGNVRGHSFPAFLTASEAVISTAAIEAPAAPSGEDSATAASSTLAEQQEEEEDEADAAEAELEYAEKEKEKENEDEVEVEEDSLFSFISANPHQSTPQSADDSQVLTPADVSMETETEGDETDTSFSSDVGFQQAQAPATTIPESQNSHISTALPSTSPASTTLQPPPSTSAAETSAPISQTGTNEQSDEKPTAITHTSPSKTQNMPDHAAQQAQQSSSSQPPIKPSSTTTTTTPRSSAAAAAHPPAAAAASRAAPAHPPPPASHPPMPTAESVPSAAAAGGSASSGGGGGGSSFWDLFSSSKPKTSDVIEWCPDLSIPPPFTTLGAPTLWMAAHHLLATQDAVSGFHSGNLQFGTIDELGEYQAMTEIERKKEGKYTARAREVAKEVLASIQHSYPSYKQRRSGVMPALTTQTNATAHTIEDLTAPLSPPPMPPALHAGNVPSTTSPHADVPENLWWMAGEADGI